MTAGTNRPAWLTVRAPSGERVEAVPGVLARHRLRTVCREARCPNVGECWGEGTATVILLGGVCTRGCAFCSVAAGTPAPPDPSEPARVAGAAAELGLMSGLLGALLHPRPRRILVVGLGTGSTAGWLADVPGGDGATSWSSSPRWRRSPAGAPP